MWLATNKRKEKRQMKTDCEILGYCPYEEVNGMDCRNYCGLGVDENEELDEFD